MCMCYFIYTYVCVYMCVRACVYARVRVITDVLTVVGVDTDHHFPMCMSLF
eukprot:m.206784 g.206784  ORF g.206784 m.206784 type:complete len:51 (+) comp32967_c1_seq1:2087-2239(+)